MAEPEFVIRAAKALCDSNADYAAKVRRLAEAADGDWLTLQEAATAEAENRFVAELLRDAAAVVIESF